MTNGRYDLTVTEKNKKKPMTHAEFKEKAKMLKRGEFLMVMSGKKFYYAER